MPANENSSRLIKAWCEGIEDFNRGKYWHAHERWEYGWLTLAERDKLYLQALIQVCGIFYLLEKKRFSGATSLCRSALEKLDKTESGHGLFPRILIYDPVGNLDSEPRSTLLELSLYLEAPQSSLQFQWRKRAENLRARLLLHGGQ